MSYQVIAPCVLAKDQNGLIHHKYEGQLIPWLSAEQAKHFLAGEEPLVVEVGAPAPAEAVDDGDETADGGVEKPAKVANKPVLIQWLVDNALDAEGNDYDADVLDKEYDKPGLWELIDAVE